ncbi:hypothetical protein RUM43_005636 [Polyplax serrata]|uniref:Uncharacterized protein n=1 Tax=Polyplax serrata TaxID=468196 RepID=A0AAN8NX26_POLSC
MAASRSSSNSKRSGGGGGGSRKNFSKVFTPSSIFFPPLPPHADLLAYGCSRTFKLYERVKKSETSSLHGQKKTLKKNSTFRSLPPHGPVIKINWIKYENGGDGGGGGGGGRSGGTAVKPGESQGPLKVWKWIPVLRGPVRPLETQTQNELSTIKLEPSHKSFENFLSKAPSPLLTRRKLENMDLDLSN